MIDFSTVKGITIPEGEVKSIAVGGKVIWQKQQQQEGFPNGYTKLDYLEFNADKTFDTGIICNQNTKIEISFTRGSSTAMYLYGVRSSGNTASITAYLTSSGAWRFGNTYKNLTFSVGTTIRNVVVDKTGLVVDGTRNYYGGTVKDFTAISTLTVGSARTTSGGYGSHQFTGKIYSFKMYDGDELILDYVPYINPDGVYGFWDTVSETFCAPII